MPYRVFNLAEVADYLHIARRDLETLVHHREIPFERQGDRLIFRKKDVDTWASQRILGLPLHRLEAYHQTSSADVQHRLGRNQAIIATLMKPEWLRADLRSKTRAAVIRDMAQLAEQTGLVSLPESLTESLREREDLCSTALNGGFALLHPRHHDPYMLEDSFIVLGRTVHPIPFGSPDGRKTDIFFLVCCQDDRIHLHVLARVCMICAQTNLLEMLRYADTADDMIRALAECEVNVISRIAE